MTKILSLILVLIGVQLHSLSAQDTLSVSYHKSLFSLYSNPLNSSKKANFVSYEIVDGDLKQYISKSLSNHEVVSLKSYKNGHPVGQWLVTSYVNEQYLTESIDYDFDLEKFRAENVEIFYLEDTTKLNKEDHFVGPTINDEKMGMQLFIARNLTYPPIALENDIQGKVIVHFVVNEDGSVSDVAIFQSADPHLDQSTLKLIKKLPIFESGILNGKAVKVGMLVPFNFKIG